MSKLIFGDEESIKIARGSTNKKRDMPEWRPRWEIERDEDGKPVRMWYIVGRDQEQS